MVVVSELPSEVAWREGEAATVAAVTQLNVAAAALVDTMAMLLATDGWAGWGIKSPVHWLQWKGAMSRGRAEGIVTIARRREELPRCVEEFRGGRLTEDAMVRIARVVPAGRDTEVAGRAAGLTISQLDRVLRSLPEVAERDEPGPDGERFVRVQRYADGTVRGRFCLPPDEGAVFQQGLQAARDDLYRERRGLPVEEEVPEAEARQIGWADALVRLAELGTDAGDRHLQRTGRPGDRHQLVIHRHLRDDGTLSPARLHNGPVLPEALARYLSCDTSITIAAHRGLELIGFTPTERTPNRQLRRWLEHRDGGCVHPLCGQTRGLHAHHLWHWEDGGPTIGSNLICLCPAHHRALHKGELTIEGNPEHGDVVIRDRFGHRIEPPGFGERPDRLPAPAQPTFVPPYGERLTDWYWN